MCCDLCHSASAELYSWISFIVKVTVVMHSHMVQLKIIRQNYPLSSDITRQCLKIEIKSESLIFQNLKFKMIRFRLSNQNLVFLTAVHQMLEFERWNAMESYGLSGDMGSSVTHRVMVGHRWHCSARSGDWVPRFAQITLSNRLHRRKVTDSSVTITLLQYQFITTVLHSSQKVRFY